jgi:hypothetical protein
VIEVHGPVGIFRASAVDLGAMDEHL